MKHKIIRYLVNQRIKRVGEKLKKHLTAVRAKNQTSTNFKLSQSEKQANAGYWNVFPYAYDGAWAEHFTAILGKFHKEFVPENLYYPILEQLLNEPEFSLAYTDKNYYDLAYKNDLFPEVIARNVSGVQMDKNYKSFSDESILNQIAVGDAIIIKPTIETGGAQNVALVIRTQNGFQHKEWGEISFQELKQKFKKNFIIQKPVRQHDFMKQFNASSINTIRVLTLRRPENNEIVILHMILRVGGEGQVVDNTKVAGVNLSIDTKSGLLNAYALDKYANKVSTVGPFDLQDGIQFPFMETIRETADYIASRNIHARLLGLDIYIAENGEAKCIEVNNRGNEINFYQTNSGPLFGDYSDEVKSFCLKQLPTIYKTYTL